MDGTLGGAGRAGSLGVFQCTLHGLIRGGILKLDVHEVGTNSQRTCQDERNTPTPLVNSGFRHDSVHDRCKRAAHQQTNGGGSGNNRAVHAALVGGCVFCQKRCSARILAGCGKALNHAQQQQQRRSGHAPRHIAGQQADAERGASHHEHGHGKRPLAALLVAHVPPEDCADGSQQKRQREHCKRLNQRKSRVVVREENLRDDDREI